MTRASHWMLVRRVGGKNGDPYEVASHGPAMANVRVSHLQARSADASARARMRTVSVLVEEVSLRLASTQARVHRARGDERLQLAEELAQLENDWRCLVAVQAYAHDPARAD